MNRAGSIFWSDESRGDGGKTRRVATPLNGAFTLLELVLVMILISIALAEAAPQLRGFLIGSRLKNATSDLVATAEWARTESISNGCTYRITCDANGYQVLYQDQQTFVPTDSTMGRRVDLPDDIHLELTRQDEAPGDHIDFFADGTTEPGTFTLTQTNNGQMRVTCLSPSERFHVEKEGQQ
ncbi:MAG TPA: GspH/FimT family pseudopilin [Tepidisphaeraceae bacterium]|nr:GspH/FimT family pseudopilin [Tepidisphaeraceae bacterium]